MRFVITTLIIIVKINSIFICFFMTFQYNALVDVLRNIPLKWGYPKWSPENWFQKEVMEYLRMRGWFVYHIEDTSWQSRLLDVYAVTPDGVELFMELKVTDWFTFNLSRFETDQVKFLLLREKYNLPAYVMIFSKRTNTHVLTTYRELVSAANDKNGVKLFS